jgi:putative endonuclease
MNLKEFGKKGEKLALKFLKKNKYKIIEKNFSSKFGEIDIIAKDKDTLAFIEVKTRKEQEFFTPLDSINFNKKMHIIKTAQDFINKHKINIPCRFDILSIVVRNDKPHFELIKNAFEITGKIR